MMKKYFILILFSLLLQSVIAQHNYKINSVLSSGQWIKISTNSEGICMITYDQLKEWGIDTPTKVAVFSNQGYMLPKMNNEPFTDDLEKIAVIHAKNNQGKDAIYFYSSGSVKWIYDKTEEKYIHELNLYTDNNYFYLTDDLEKSNNPELKSSIDAADGKILDAYDQLFLYELENINILNTGRRWYSDEITPNYSKTINFKTNGVVTNSNAYITLASTAISSSKSRHLVTVNDKLIGKQEFPYPDDVDKRRVVDTYQFTPSNNVSINVGFESDGGKGSSWLDYVTVQMKTQLNKENFPLVFRNSEASLHEKVQYKISGSFNAPYVWDITDPIHIKAISFQQSGTNIIFTDKGAAINNYILFDTKTDNFLQANFEQEVANQNIHGLPIYDFIIISHPDFISASEDLAEFHRQKDNMRVLVVTIDEVYNEFSSGKRDVAAIRNMARMFHERKTASDSLRYILLMGDGSFNNRSTDSKIPNFIPTYQSAWSEDEHSFISDDFFVMLDEDEGEAYGTLDIGIGRIPCRTIDEAKLVVTKTINYSDSRSIGDWRNVVTFIADDEDYNQYMRQTELLIAQIKNKYTGFYTEKIYFDSYTQIETASGPKYPEVTEAIKNSVEDGTLILNYIGHANERGLAKEGVLGISDISSWSNQNKLPVFVTATCELSRYDNVETSAGESILFNPAGGGVALFSTTRVVYSSDNNRLNQNFYRSVFEQDQNGENFRLGDIIRRAKNLTVDNMENNKRSFSLLGDPALVLAFPKYKVVTTKINGKEVGEDITIGALEKVTVQGEVHNYSGNILENFSGHVTTTIYDKAIDVKTQNNDNVGIFEYKVQNNIIYKGISSVTNGKFEFSFIVPKDITYNVGNGRIMYYATDGEEDGNGSTETFQIGGSNDAPTIDNEAPLVKLYMNDEKFQPYGKVASSSLLLADLFDQSGINTVGIGIGHDIIAILDDDYAKPMVLNEYYQAELNSYQRGKIIFPINDLSPGEHKISVKVWDIQNNSTVQDIFFTVEDGFEITAVHNYPNPVSFSTTFSVSHNLPGTSFSTTVELFNLSGYRIWEIKESTGSHNSVVANIRWDITDTNYPIDKEKLLIYRVTMVNQQGIRATRSGKLLLNVN